MAAAIDCRTCGRCCTVMSPPPAKRDVRRLAEALPLPEEKLINEYLRPGEDKGRDTPRQRSCPFPKDRLRAVCEARPDNRGSFPNLHKRDFRSRLLRVVENGTVCPIVHDVPELLKWEFRRGRRRRAAPSAKRRYARTLIQGTFYSGTPKTFATGADTAFRLETVTDV